MTHLTHANDSESDITLSAELEHLPFDLKTENVNEISMHTKTSLIDSLEPEITNEPTNILTDEALLKLNTFKYARPCTIEHPLVDLEIDDHKIEDTKTM